MFSGEKNIFLGKKTVFLEKKQKFVLFQKLGYIADYLYIVN